MNIFRNGMMIVKILSINNIMLYIRSLWGFIIGRLRIMFDRMFFIVFRVLVEDMMYVVLMWDWLFWMVNGGRKMYDVWKERVYR